MSINHMPFFTICLLFSFQEGSDLSSYTISEIANCKLEVPDVVPSIKTKIQLLQETEISDYERAGTIVRQVRWQDHAETFLGDDKSSF